MATFDIFMPVGHEINNNEETDSHQMTGLGGFTPERRTAGLWSLVLWACNLPNFITRKAEGGWFVKVPSGEEERARREISAFEEENKNWPPVQNKVADLPAAARQPPTVLLMGGLLIFFAVTGPWAAGSPWFANGAAIGRLILGRHEWWRVVTALTLHADLVHLLGNILIGGVIVHFLCRTIGSGFGWLLLLLAGAAGNYINIVLHGAAHQSVGFSTAVFGAIGILTGRQSLLNRGLRVKDLLAPLAAGAGLLALLGTSGEHTDLGAHFFGLLVGLSLGILTTFIPRKWTASLRLQSLILIFCLLVVALCWRVALN